MVWQMLAALVFLSAMIRALWLPETSNGCQLCEAGICTFLLCFCWELPRVLVLLFHGITAADLPEVLFGFWHVLHRRAGAVHCGAGGRK